VRVPAAGRSSLEGQIAASETERAWQIKGFKEIGGTDQKRNTHGKLEDREARSEDPQLALNSYTCWNDPRILTESYLGSL